jgi:hypothetical protein
LVAAAFLLTNAAEAAFNVSDPIPGSLRLVAIDAEPSGNTATSVVDVDTSHAAAVGSSFNVDIVVDEFAAENKLTGWDMDFHYNPSVLRVTGFDRDLLIAAAPGSFLLDGSDVPPDTDGDFFTGVVDLTPSAAEMGEGVLVRFTLECLAPGTSSLFLDYLLADTPDPWIYYDADPGPDPDFQPIPIITNQAATVTCGAAATPNPAVGGGVALAVSSTSSDSAPSIWYIAPLLAIAAAATYAIRSHLTRRRS